MQARVKIEIKKRDTVKRKTVRGNGLRLGRIVLRLKGSVKKTSEKEDCDNHNGEQYEKLYNAHNLILSK